MVSNIENIIAIIADSQDGSKLTPNDEYSEFILLKIQHNTQNELVNVENLIQDFNYMINQLQSAVQVLEKENA